MDTVKRNWRKRGGALLTAIAVLSALIFLSSCGAGTKNALDDFLKGKAKSGPSDEALTIVDENKKVNEGESTGGTSQVIEPPDSKTADKKDSLTFLNPDGENAVKPSTSKPKSAVSASSAPRGNYISDAEIKKLILSKQYDKVIASKINPKSANQVYYSGNAHFVLALQFKVGTKERERHVAAAEKLFRDAGVMEADKVRKARALLWHGITMYRFRSDRYDQETISKPFRYITQKLSDTPYHNDALMYLGIVYGKFNQKESAKEFLTLLAKTDPRDRVYDIDYKKWSSPQTASRHYMNLLGGAEGAVRDESLIPPPSKDKLLTTTPAVKNEPVRDEFMEKVERIHREIIGDTNKPAARPTSKSEDEEAPSAGIDNGKPKDLSHAPVARLDEGAAKETKTEPKAEAKTEVKSETK
ncbi:MAG: hypothetical protein JNM63_02905, partial [Spirochaetia bacterium]|nr:hypothetical protein [Spirochaetia bacterium]